MWHIWNVYRFFYFPILKQFLLFEFIGHRTTCCMSTNSSVSYSCVQINPNERSKKAEFLNFNTCIFYLILMQCFCKMIFVVGYWWTTHLRLEIVKQDKCPKYNGSSKCPVHYRVQQFTVSSKIQCPHLLLICMFSTFPLYRHPAVLSCFAMNSRFTMKNAIWLANSACK